MNSLLKLSTIFVFLILFSFCTSKNVNPLNNKIICIDPGHGGTAETDSFRVGPSGEREEWINLRVALILKEKLEQQGASVLMTRTTDAKVDLKERAKLAKENQAAVFISIHHNATADSAVNFPIIYFHGNASENQASVQLGKIVAQHLSDSLYGDNSPVSLVSDHVIFPESGTAVLRYSYGIPGIIGEASFFTNPSEEQRLKNEQYNQKEAEAYLNALETYFLLNKLPILEKYSDIKIIPFPVFQETNRMNEIAKKWKDDYETGEQLLNSNNVDSLSAAYNLFTRSLKSFPDSWIAGEAHTYRMKILKQLGKWEEAKMEKRRIKEFYILPESKL